MRNVNGFFPLLIIAAGLAVITPSLIYGRKRRTIRQNNTTTAQNFTATTQGFGGPPFGPLTAVRHVFDDPSLRVWHFCKPNVF